MFLLFPPRRGLPAKTLLGILTVCLIAIFLLAATLQWKEAGTPWPSAAPFAALFPTPTPTPDRARLAAEAHRTLTAGLALQKEGDYETAIKVYQNILSLYPDTPSAPEAAFRLGESHLLRGDATAALAAFRRVLTDHPASSYAQQALFLAGQAAAELGDAAEAIAHYSAYAALRPDLQGYVALRLADLYRAGGRYQEALAAYQMASGADLPHIPRVNALQGMAEVYSVQGEQRLAADIYEEILTRARTPSYRAFVLYRLALARKDGKEVERAGKAFLQIVNDYPDSAYALPALEALEDLKSAGPTDFQRALVYFYAGKYQEAIATWRHYIKVTPFGEGTGRARYHIGLAYQRQGEHRQAVTEFDALIRLYPKGPLLAEARLAKARSLQLMGDTAAAAREYLTVHRYYPGTPQGERGLWEGAMALYRLGDVSGAISAWQESLTAYPKSSRRTPALFWLGKALLSQGRSREGTTYLAKAAQKVPPDYYALRAGEILAQMAGGRTAGIGPDVKGQGFPHPYLLRLTAQSEEDALALKAWIATWAGSGSDQGRSQASHRDARTRVLADPHFARGRDLLAIHLWEEAGYEFDRALEELGQDPWALLEMAYLLQESGRYDYSIKAAHRLLGLSPAALAGDVPPPLQRLLYPSPFQALINTMAAKYGLDVFWFLALIRQESMFNPRATSYADARGLTQVIPSTARMIAERLRVTDFRLEDLYRPGLSLEFGAYYLAEMLRLTKGDIWLALASYNGGYGNAIRWAGGEQVSDPDLFVEHITFGETRRYLQLVYENYRLYRALY